MSTFSGLSTALSSLIAQRQALDVHGQNVANANTPGYTRQRVDLQSVQALSAPTMFSTGLVAGNGVKLVGITRIGDVFLDARVRSETATASFRKAQTAALDRLESTLAEPGGTGVSQALQAFWAGWEDVGNRPDDAAARKVLLGDAQQVVDQIATGYRSVETQWTQARQTVDTLVNQVNTISGQVAHLNEQIRSILVSGGSANELMDQRDLLVTSLSELVGATARHREDGTLDVLVGGNALVRGVKSHEITSTGSYEMQGGTTGTPPDEVRLVWVSNPDAVVPAGGTLGSHLADLSADGVLAHAATTWNDMADRLAAVVNAVHETGTGLDGVAGRSFFDVPTGAGAPPSALGLRVALTDPDEVAAADATRGPLDGSIASAIAELATDPAGPDLHWRAFVVDIGVRTRAAEQQATVAEASRATAVERQLSQASVDLDEEMVTMLAAQRAYEGAARVLTAVDEMLDVLINRTGRVGR